MLVKLAKYAALLMTGITLILLNSSVLFGQINYAPNPHWAPIDFINDQGKHDGLIAEYVKLLQTDLKQDTFQYRLLNSWTDMLLAIKSGDVDMIGAIHKTPERENYLLFSETLFKLPVYLISHRKTNIQDCNPAQLRLAVVHGYASADYISQNFPEANIAFFHSDLEALLQTSLGKTDATIMDLVSANYYIKQYELHNLKAHCKLNFDWEICIGVTKSKPALFETVQLALSNIPFETRDSLFYAYLAEHTIPEKSLLQEYKRPIILTLIFLGSLLVSSLLLVYILKRRVAQKGQELKNKTELFELASQAASDAIFELLPNEKLLHFKEGFLTLFGYHQNDPVHNFKNWFHYIHPEDQNRFYSSCMIAVKSDDTFFQEEFRFKMANDEYCWVQLRCFLVRRKDGWVNRVVGALQDLSSRRQYLDAVTQHNSRLQDIAWLQSHVIRAPLARLMSLVHIFELDTHLSQNEQKKYLGLIQASANELDQVIHEIAQKTNAVQRSDDYKQQIST
ncbi:MAG: PAS domain-containing protein [Bacteroidia bacterium]